MCLLCLGATIGAGLAAETASSAYWLDRDTLPGAELYRDPASGLVKAFIGNISFYGVEGTPEEIARLFLLDYSDVLQVAPSTSDLVLDKVTESLAALHVRFHQVYNGLPIWRGHVAVHMTKDYHITVVQNDYLPPAAIGKLAPAAITAEAAAQAAAVAALPTRPLAASDPAVKAEVEQYIYASQSVTPRLAYVVHVRTTDTSESWVVIVDAGSGAILEQYSTIVTLDGYAKLFVPNPVVTSGNHNLANNWGDDTSELTAQLSPEALWLTRLAGSPYNYTLGSYVDAQLDAAIGYRAYSATEPRYFSYTRGHDNFEEPMVYYHMDAAQVYAQELGYANANNRIQPAYTNMLVMPGLTDPRNAAYYPDETYYPIRFGRPAGNHPDLAEDADIILHEYNHAMLDALQGQYYPFGSPVPGTASEGSADFFAANFYLHVGEAFKQGWNNWIADWAFEDARISNGFEHDYRLRDVTCTASTDSYNDVNPPSDVHRQAPFWSSLFWDISRATGRDYSTKLWLEWASTIGSSVFDWTIAANTLIAADNALNQTPGYESKNHQVLVRLLKEKEIPYITDESARLVAVQLEHGDLSKLRIKIGVRPSSGPGVSHTIAEFGNLTGSGTKTWVKDVTTDWPASYWPPRSDYVWFVSVEEKSTDKRISDQGVIRCFQVSQGATVYSATHYDHPTDPNLSYDQWFPIKEDVITEVTTSGSFVAPSSYAEVKLGHSDCSQLEMLLGVKDLGDPAGVPTWQLRLTKQGLTGWDTVRDSRSPSSIPARGALGPKVTQGPRVVRVKLDDLGSRLPPSLARRWYLVARDRTADDFDGWVTDFRLYHGGSYPGYYQGTQLPADVPIDETRSIAVDLAASPPSKPSGYVALSTQGTINSIRLGVPSWTSGADTSAPYIFDLTAAASWLPPVYSSDWHRRWFVRAQNTGATQGTVSLFGLYDSTSNAPRAYRSAGLPLDVPGGTTKEAYVPYSQTASFTDVPVTHWAWMQIEGCKKAGIVGGYGDGTYRPTNAVDRASMAVFVARAHHGTSDLAGYTPPGTATFPDVPTTHWAFKYVEYCYSRGIVGGYTDGTYRPDNVVNRGDMAIFIARAAGAHHRSLSRPPTDSFSFPDISGLAEEYRQAIEYLYSAYNDSAGNVVGGYEDGTYRPSLTVTRDAMAVFIARGFAVPQ